MTVVGIKDNHQSGVDINDNLQQHSVRVEQTMLRNPNQGERDGERSDYVRHHLGGMVVPLPVTP